MRTIIRGALGALLVSLLGAAPATAAPVTYFLTEGTLDTVFIVTVDGGTVTTAPPIQMAIALTGASVTIDEMTGELLDMTVSVSDPVQLQLGGVNGWESVTFSNAVMQTTGTTALLPTGSGSFDANAVSSTISALVNLEPVDPSGFNPAVLPASGDTITDLVELDILQNGTIQVDLNGAVLGELGALVGGQISSAFVTANFSFQAAPIPEPGSALLFSLGLVVAGMGIRRRLEV